MEESDFLSIENSEEAKDLYGHNYGSDTKCISLDDIEELKNGKLLATDINRRRIYVIYILMQGW